MRIYLIICLCFPAFVIASEYVSAQVLIPEGYGNWRYSEEDSDDRWASPEFDDTAWNRGATPIGFGERSLATVVREVKKGEKIPISTYFRADFQVPQAFVPSDVPSDVALPQILRFKIRVDDGCLVFLNGQECYRWNMPKGPINRESVASQALSAPEETLFHQFDIASGALRSGRNVLAIEVHQSNELSTDLYLDLRLAVKSLPTLLSVQANEDPMASSLRFNSLHKIDAKSKIPDGFRDGGREMQIDEFGTAISSREILHVDRMLDANLAKHLEYARSDELKKLSPIDRATRIARYVDRIMTPDQGRGVCEIRSEYLSENYASRDVLLGDVVDLCGAGVCRHRALLFKLMADEALLSSALVRGNFGTLEKSSGHTWNELSLDNQEVMIVDVMNPQPDFYFPVVGESSLRFYLTVAKALKYPPAP